MKFRISPTFQCLTIVLLVIVTDSVRAEWFRFSDTAMTTPVTLELWAGDEQGAERTTIRYPIELLPG